MAITFNTNLAALGAQRNIGIASGAASSSLAKLSSGSRVPQAKDDAAGLAIGSKLKSEVAGLTQASNNAAQAISLLQIADGALSSIGDMLQRMKALAVQSSSGQLDNASRSLLDQEFQGLLDEVNRVAGLTNFNGTELLAGSTEVATKVNNISGVAGTNLIGQGFDKIEFANSFGDGAIKIEFDQATDVLTVTDLARNKFQSITLEDATAIAVGETEEYNFGDIGVKITLNSNFSKTTDIKAANTVVVGANPTDETAFTATASAIGTWGLTGPASITTSITGLNFAGTGADALNAALLDGVTLTAEGAHTAVTFGDVVIGGHTFSTSDTAGTDNDGTFTFTFSDGQNNSFEITMVTTTDATAGTAAGTVTLALAAPAGAIEASGNGANAPKLVSITQAVPDPDTGLPVPFNFGNVDASAIVLDLTDAANTGAAITIGGVVFNTTNTGGVDADLESTGVKTLTLANANGDSFTVQFNVTSAFRDGDTATINLLQFGQVVGADSITTGSTEFSFKVGSGTSANDNISFELNSATADALGIDGVAIGTAAGANAAITAVNSAITAVASRRADIGAAQSRLDFASTSISVAIENTTAAASALLDVDVSAEITKFTNQNVLMQAGISLLGQANQQPALLLRLLQ